MELESILLPGIEAKRPIVIAGPCSAETEEQVMETAKQLAAKGQKDIPCRYLETAYQTGRFRRNRCGRTCLAEGSEERNRYVCFYRGSDSQTRLRMF